MCSNELIISGSENQLISPKENTVGTWWNHEIIQAKAQISAVSGRIIDQKVTFLGKEKLNLYGKTYNTLHFNLSSTDESLPESKKLNIITSHVITYTILSDYTMRLSNCIIYNFEL